MISRDFCRESPPFKMISGKRTIYDDVEHVSFLDYLGDQTSDLHLVGKITDDDLDLASQSLDLIVRLGVLGRTLDEENVCPCTSERQSHRGADASGPAGDQSRLARQAKEIGEVVLLRSRGAHGRFRSDLGVSC